MFWRDICFFQICAFLNFDRKRQEGTKDSCTCMIKEHETSLQVLPLSPAASSCLSHTHSWVMLPWIKQKAPEVGILLHFLKIDQRVKDAPHFLFLIKIQDKAAERLRCNHKAFICKWIIKLIYLNTNACSRCLSLLLKEYSTVLCDFLLGHF